jgi:hypothetical protein
VPNLSVSVMTDDDKMEKRNVCEWNWCLGETIWGNVDSMMLNQ